MRPDERPQEPPRRGLADARAWAVRARGALSELARQAATANDPTRPTPFVPAGEEVELDVRRSPVLLLLPGLRTAVGLFVLAVGADLYLLLGFALATAAWARARLDAGLRTTATVAACCTLALVVLQALVGTSLCLVLLLGWTAEDVADWWSDRLVVSNKRIYRRFGVITRHAPSISLTAVAYIDPAITPVGRVLGFGTLYLDSAAQRDAPLSHFEMVPDVQHVADAIMRLRSAALPKFPPPPYRP